MNRVASDIILSTIGFLGAGSTFPADLPEIHTFFHKMSLNERFAQLFEEVIFDESQWYPFCRSVDFAFDRMGKSDLLLSLSLDNYIVSKALEMKDFTGIFSAKEIKLISEMAKLFKAELCLASSLVL